jgi:hypothetical protein
VKRAAAGTDVNDRLYGGINRVPAAESVRTAALRVDNAYGSLVRCRPPSNSRGRGSLLVVYVTPRLCWVAYSGRCVPRLPGGAAERRYQRGGVVGAYALGGSRCG